MLNIWRVYIVDMSVIQARSVVGARWYFLCIGRWVVCFTCARFFIMRLDRWVWWVYLRCEVVVGFFWREWFMLLGYNISDGVFRRIGLMKCVHNVGAMSLYL